MQTSRNRRPISIMLIEDDTDIHELLRAFFSSKDYVLQIYDSAEKALQILAAKRSTFDAILVDYRLPSMNGLEFIKRAKLGGSLAPIIVMTADQSTELALECIDSGAYDYIVKPLHLPQLKISVERALQLRFLHEENIQLLAAVRSGSKHGPAVIGSSLGLRNAVVLAKRVASSSANVFIHGESGTGKEVIARMIHAESDRRDKPFVAINCSAIPESLLESELFGHAKGSFTGAVETRIGLFEEAGAGTVFLDEIGDLSLSLQAKLLRVLQERQLKRVGENTYRPIDARILSATHRDLRAAVVEGTFREDLYFRINVIPIHLPPLRERREDILPLAEFFLQKFSTPGRRLVRGFTKAAAEALHRFPWRGNVRELENTVERAVVLCQSEMIDVSDLMLDLEMEAASDRPKSVESDGSSFPVLQGGKLLTMNELQLRYIQFALTLNDGAKDRTAKDLGIDRKTLYRKVTEIQSGLQ